MSPVARAIVWRRGGGGAPLEGGKEINPVIHIRSVVWRKVSKNEKWRTECGLQWHCSSGMIHDARLEEQHLGW